MQVNQSLSSIVQLHDCTLTRIALDLGADVNYVDADGKFPLFYAYEQRMVAQMALLLLRRADPNKLYRSSTILYMECNKKEPNPTIIRLLLDNGADPNIVTEDKHPATTTGGRHALLSLVEKTHFADIRILLQHPRTIIDLRADNGVTALMRAAEFGYDRVVMLLLAKGADPNLQRKDGCNALMLAAMHNKHSTLTILLLHPGIKLNITNCNGNTALHYAYMFEKYMAAYILLKSDIDKTIRNVDNKTAIECCKSRLEQEFYEECGYPNSESVKIPTIVKDANIESVKIPTMVKDATICLETPAAEMLFKVPNPNKCDVKYASLGCKYRIWNDIFQRWDSWKDIPMTLQEREVAKCEYIDGQFPYHMICDKDGKMIHRIQFFGLVKDGVFFPIQYS